MVAAQNREVLGPPIRLQFIEMTVELAKGLLLTRHVQQIELPQVFDKPLPLLDRHGLDSCHVALGVDCGQQDRGQGGDRQWPSYEHRATAFYPAHRSAKLNEQ